MDPRLIVVMYHYVRDLERTPFPRIKGLDLAGFRAQVDELRGRFEMATLESALAFLEERYEPRKDLCLLTFDDGLKEHAETVTPILAEQRVQGLFFVPTAGVEEARVLSVHKNHFLMASLDFAQYRDAVLEQIERLAPSTETRVDSAAVATTYRWDEPEVATLKYLLNFRLSETLRNQVLDALFPIHLGDERQFARNLYVSWDDARAMQGAGMVIGGHSHGHTGLATMTDHERQRDLETCTRLLRQRLHPQPSWPFSYPFGKRASYGDQTVSALESLGYSCAFATEPGTNVPGGSLFEIRRIDTKDVPVG